MTRTSGACPPCYACGHATRSRLVGITSMHVCGNCRMGMVQQSSVTTDYWNRGDSKHELDGTHWRARKTLFQSALRQIEAATGPGRAVDLGGGLGYFAEAALQRGWDAYSLDTSPLAQTEAAERLGEDRSLSSVDATGFSGTCDLVSLWCVIAHVSDPLALIEQAVDLLKPGGTLLLTTPNFLFQAAYARVLKRLGRPLDFVAHDHYMHFTPSALDRLLEKTGLGSWSYHYLGVTEDCILDSRLSWLLVPAKRAWNRWGLLTTVAGLPPLCAELQVLGTKRS